MDTTFTAQADKILNVIRQHEGWVKRRDIARGLGKNALNTGDLALLQYLAEQGLIEIVSVPTRAPSGQRMEYKAVKS
jgi:hypothetical protein